MYVLTYLAISSKANQLSTSALSKLLERTKNKLLVTYLTTNTSARNQSANRKGNSMVTAILKIYTDITNAIASEQAALIMSTGSISASISATLTLCRPRHPPTPRDNLWAEIQYTVLVWVS